MHFGTFLRSFFNSLTNPKYYIDVLNVRLWFSIRFVVLGYLFLTVVATFLFTVIDIPKLQPSLDSFLEAAVRDFPEEQNFKWNGLRLSSNQTSTYALAFPKLPDATDTPPYLLQVNPEVHTSGEISGQSKGGSLFFAGQNQLYVSQPSSGWSNLPLTQLLTTDTFTIDKASLVNSLPKLHQSLQQFVKFLPVAFAVFFLCISFPFQVVNVLLDTIFIYLIVKMFGLPLNLKKVVQISLHITVIAELVNILTANFAGTLPMFTIAFWGYTIIVYWQLRHIKAFPTDEVAHQEKG